MREIHFGLVAAVLVVWGLNFINPASAQQAPEGFVIVEAVETADIAVRSVHAGDSILKLKTYAPFAIKLDEDVGLNSDLAMRASIDPSAPLRRGVVLIATENRSGRYCVPLRASGIGMAGACLIDSNADGKFDGIQKVAFTSINPDGMAVSKKGNVIGVRHKQIEALPSPISYSPVDYHEGPAGEADLRWGGKRAKIAGQSSNIAFWFDYDRTEGPLSVPTAVTVDAGPGRIEIFGFSLQLMGFDTSKSLLIQSASVKSGVRASMTFRNRAMGMMIYL